MQRENNMAKTFEFVYAMIIFILLFLVEKNVVAYLKFECKTDDDCQKSQLKTYVWKCVKNECYFFAKK